MYLELAIILRYLLLHILFLLILQLVSDLLCFFSLFEADIDHQLFSVAANHQMSRSSLPPPSLTPPPPPSHTPAVPPEMNLDHNDCE